MLGAKVQHRNESFHGATIIQYGQAGSLPHLILRMLIPFQCHPLRFKRNIINGKRDQGKQGEGIS